jgi:hypothetical protein
MTNKNAASAIFYWQRLSDLAHQIRSRMSLGHIKPVKARHHSLTAIFPAHYQ